MAKMLDIAEKRNPDKLLEKPFKLGETPVQTIGEGVNAYRDQEWAKIYNICITMFSTVGLEVILFEKPLITICILKNLALI